MGQSRRDESSDRTVGQTVLSAIHRFSGAIAGLLFLVGVPLALSSAEAWGVVRLPVIPTGDENTIRAFLSVVSLFAFFVLLETVSGIAAWIFGALKRLFV